MMKVKAEHEDLDNSRLQSEVRKLQRTLDAKLAEPASSTEADGKLQEQLQALTEEKAALQEQLQQQSQKQVPGGMMTLPPSPKKEGRDQGYPQTWKLVDQLRNQNRSACRP